MGSLWLVHVADSACSMAAVEHIVGLAGAYAHSSSPSSKFMAHVIGLVGVIGIGLRPLQALTGQLRPIRHRPITLYGPIRAHIPAN